MIKKGKEDYFEKMKKKALEARNSKAYFYAIQMLGSKEAPKMWELRVLFPNLIDQEIAEKLAEYFNRISNEFIPLNKAETNAPAFNKLALTFYTNNP